MVKVAFAESYKNVQQDSIQSAYFGNASAILQLAVMLTLEDLLDQNVVVFTEKSEHDRMTSMIFLQKIERSI